MELITQHICLEKDVGAHGNLFGGIMMAWLDEAAAIKACMVAGTNRMVTAVADQIKFIQPVKVGDIVQFKGVVEKLGNTSITIRLSVDAVDPETKSERHVCETKMVFVKIDKWGNKVKISKT